MFKVLLPASLAIGSAFGQTPMQSGIARAIEMHAQIKAARTMEETSQTLQVERDRIRAETELLRQQAEALRAERERAQQRPQISPEIKRAFLKIRSEHEDFDLYLPEVKRLSTIFGMGESPDWNVESYLEGLYLIAKHASFSQAPRHPVALVKEKN